MKSIALMLILFVTVVAGCGSGSEKGEDESEQQSPVVNTPPPAGVDENPGRPDAVRRSDPTDQ